MTNKTPSFKVFGFQGKTKHKLPYYVSKIPAGFPSPADDYIERKLDLNEHLVLKPAATFFVQVDGDSMKDSNIVSGDILIVDRSKEDKDGKIVVAMLDGEFTVKRFKKEDKKAFLMPENDKFKPIEITEDNDFEVWGVVTYIIHQAK